MPACRLDAEDLWERLVELPARLVDERQHSTYEDSAHQARHPGGMPFDRRAGWLEENVIFRAIVQLISRYKPCSGNIIDLNSVNYMNKNATFQLLDI